MHFEVHLTNENLDIIDWQYLWWQILDTFLDIFIY